MKKTDTNYLCSYFKETKMLEKVTIGYRQQSRITRLFYNRRYPGSSQIIPRYGWIMAAAFNVELRARSTGNATGLVYG